MKPRNTSTHVVSASLVLILCASIAVVSFREVRKIEAPPPNPLPHLATGENHLQLLTPTGCAGTIDVVLENRGGARMTGTGRIMVWSRGGSAPLTLTVDIRFSDHGELILAEAELRSRHGMIHLLGTGPRPLLFTVAGTGGSGGFSKRFPLPGPLLLGRQSDGSFTLRYPILDGAVQRYRDGLLGILRAESRITLRKAGTGGEDCAEGALHAADLSPLLFRTSLLVGAASLLKAIL